MFVSIYGGIMNLLKKVESKKGKSFVKKLRKHYTTLEERALLAYAAKGSIAGVSTSTLLKLFMDRDINGGEDTFLNILTNTVMVIISLELAHTVGDEMFDGPENKVTWHVLGKVFEKDWKVKLWKAMERMGLFGFVMSSFLLNTDIVQAAIFSSVSWMSFFYGMERQGGYNLPDDDVLEIISQTELDDD